jgi:hypothetical protein
VSDDDGVHGCSRWTKEAGEGITERQHLPRSSAGPP